MKWNSVGCLLGALALSLAPLRAQDEAAKTEESSEGRKLERIEALLAKHPEPFKDILARARELRVQVLLGEVVEVDGKPSLRQSGWRVDAEYFYPASTVKLVAATVALEQLNLAKRELAPAADERTPLAFHPLFKGETLEAEDPTNVDGGTITLEHLIRKALIVSDNAAYNRLYDFCGQQFLNERAWRAGLVSAKLSHRLSISQSPVDAKRTCAIELRLPTGPVVLEAQWSNVGELGVIGPKGVFVGKGHRDRGGVVNRPMSFFYKSCLSLSDLQLMLARVVRPDIELRGAPFEITDAQRDLLKDALSVYPGDSKNPVYDRAQYPDNYAKPFLSGIERVIPKENIKIFDKVGVAYGFVTDTAYIVDTSTNKGFFLAATIYANSDEVLNDDKYDYDTVAFPFLANLAEVVARDVWGK